MRDEIRRLLLGPETGEPLPGFAVMQVNVTCPGNASEVYQRASEALTVILSVHKICGNRPIADEWETDPAFTLLEEWFYNSFEKHAPEIESPVTDNVRWFNDSRDWFWWDARVVDANRLVVYISVEGFPISGFDLLRWLLLSCGASEVEQGPSVDISEIPKPSQSSN